MTTRVVEPNEIFLNDTRFRIRKKVRSSNASTYPQKRITGDFNKDSQRHLSVHTWDTQDGGIGHKTSRPGVTNRAWSSQMNTRGEGHILLPAEHTLTANPTVASDGLLSELGGKILAAFGTDIREYDEGGDSWGSSLRTTGATPTDVANGALGTKEFLVYAIGTGYEFSSSSAIWGQSTKDALNIVFFDERLWGIDATGQLWFSFTVGSAEENDALLPLDQNDAITGLFVGRSSSPPGEEILYVSTKKGLWFHDLGGRKFIKTSAFLPGHAGDAAERVAIQWRDRIYLGAGLGINEFGPGQPATFRPMGYDLPDGIPTSTADLLTSEVNISSLAASTIDLLAGGKSLNSGDEPQILAWNGSAWQVVWQGASANTSVYSMHISDSGGEYRCWLANANRVRHFRLPQSGSPASQITGWDYDKATVLSHEYPVFTADQEEITKVLMKMTFKVEGAGGAFSQNERVLVFTDIDDAGYVQRTKPEHTNSSNFSAANDYIDAVGTTVFLFPTVADPAGTEFKTLQIRFDMRSFDDTTKSPDIRSVTIEYLKVLDDKDSFDFEIDASGDYFDLTPQEIRAAFATAKRSKALVQLTYRDDTGGTRNPYVKVFEAAAEEETGYDEQGTILVHCEEI